MANTGTQTTLLYGRTTPSITLLDALQECANALKDGIALLYSPTRCQFGKLQSDGVLQNFQGNEIPLDYALGRIFEARIFNEESELRWLNELEGKGRAVLISENDISGYLGQSISSISALNTIPQTYLLWGEGTQPIREGNERIVKEGWSRLAAARIGALDVPLDGATSKKKRVYLKTCEYLAEVDKENGNVAVVEERLMKLEVK